MAEAQPERFTLQDYFTPSGERRLRRFPRLGAQAFRIVWDSASRDLVACVVLQGISALALAGQLLMIRNLLNELLSGGSDTFASSLPEIAALAGLGAVVALTGVVLSVRSRILGQL